MGEILGIGCTHAPHLQFPDANMADIVRRTLQRDSLPAELKDPQNWPAAMRDEWGNDEGLTSARRHRQELVEGFRQARAALDEFRPDFVLIWGDDQYENFHEDLIPPFAIYALEEFDSAPFKNSGAMLATTNVWNEDPNQIVKMKGHPVGATELAKGLINSGFDVATSFKFHHAQYINHAFVRTVMYLDYDRRGFGYPVVPFHVNCYGSDLWSQARRADLPSVPPPPSPPPWRCYDLGRQVATLLEASPYRVAVIGSSSWSHAFLTPKFHGLYPDVEADRERFNELQSGQFKKWRDLDLGEMRKSGQHEMLNWICLAGAMEGRQVKVQAYSETYIFNSSKAVVTFPVPAKV